MYTTLEQIKSYSPCEPSWKKLLKGLNKTKADSEPLEFRTIYNILDADDIFWSIKVLDKKQRVYIGALFADTVSHLTKDKRVHDCITVCFKYGKDEATEEELKNAADATAYTATYTTTAAAHAAYVTAADFSATDAAYTTAADAAADANAASSVATTVYAAYDATYDATKDKLALIFLTYIERV